MAAHCDTPQCKTVCAGRTAASWATLSRSGRRSSERTTARRMLRRCLDARRSGRPSRLAHFAILSSYTFLLAICSVASSISRSAATRTTAPRNRRSRRLSAATERAKKRATMKNTCAVRAPRDIKLGGTSSGNDECGSTHFLAVRKKRICRSNRIHRQSCSILLFLRVSAQLYVCCFFSQ